MNDEAPDPEDEPDVVADVYLTTSLERLERRAEALADDGEHAALLELIATLRRHTAAMREHLHGLGAEELGTRADALAERADALERRERELRAAEALLEERAAIEARQLEWGAEARTVFAHAREDADSFAAVDAEAALVARREALEARAGEVHATAPEPEPEPTHLLFVPAPEGYQLVERAGPCPARGETVRLGERDLHVAKVARSPLPGDRRLCAHVL